LKRYGIILFVLVGLFLPVIANAGSQQSSEFHPAASVDFWVDTNDWYSYYWNDISAGYSIDVDIDVTSGNDIDFFITDGENYDLWVDDQSSNAYLIRENVGSVSVSFTIPHSGEWRVVFLNDDWLYRKHIEGTISAFAPPTTTITTSSPLDSDVVGPLVIFAVIIFLIGMTIACCKKVEDRQKESRQGHQVPQQTSYEVPVHKEQVVMFCQYCGTQRQSSDAQFCSRCGKSFSGPEL